MLTHQCPAGTCPAPEQPRLQIRIYRHALATGFSRRHSISAGVLALALAVIRVRREDLSSLTWRRHRPMLTSTKPGVRLGTLRLPSAAKRDLAL